MELRRSGRRDERRRRVLMDDPAAAGDAAELESATLVRSRGPARGRSYSNDARAECQPRVTDLFPVRRFWRLVIILIMLTAITGLVAAFGQLEQLPGLRKRGGLAAFDFQQRGNLAHCLASLLLAGCTVISIFIYRLRRHKVDDYRGRYRLWLWVAGLMALGSLDATAGLYRVAGVLVQQLDGGRILASAASWQTLIALSLTLPLLLRCTFELWCCRAAVVGLAAAAACYAAAQASASGWIWPAEDSFTLILSTTFTLLGSTSLLAAGLTFGSHVYRDSQGLLVIKTQRAGTRKTVRKAEGAPARSQKEPAPPKEQPPERAEQTATPIAGRIKPGATIRAAKSAAGAESDDVDDKDISKAERRRLRKQQRRQARAA